MDKENIIGIVRQLTASERVQFIELLNEYTLADKIGTNTYRHIDPDGRYEYDVNKNGRQVGEQIHKTKFALLKQIEMKI